MRSLDRWFRSELKRQQRAVFLEDAVFSGRFASYAWYRLRYFFGRTFFAALLHAIEFLFLFYIFRGDLLLEALLVRTAAVFANSWWWGALEILREEVRGLHRDKKLRLAPRVISEWLAVSLGCAAFLLLAGAAWVLLDTRGPEGTFGLFHFYVLASCIRLALSCVARTYHSGVYAIRRIYRPFVTLVCIDLFGFTGILLLWPLMGQWSFPLVLILTSIVAMTITVFFVREVYSVLGLLPLRPTFARKFVKPMSILFDRRFYLAGSSYALMKMDALLVFAFFYDAYGDQGRYQAFVGFFLISPLVRAAHDWAQLFYFDFKRLELDLFADFRRRFERFVSHLSWVLGGIFWVLACVYATLLLQRNLGFFYLSLGIFFLIRSRLAFFQVHAFAGRRYIPLFISGVLLLSGAVLVALLATGDQGEQILLLTLVLVGALIYLERSRPEVYGILEAPDLLSPPEWLSRVASLSESVRIRSVRFWRDVDERVVEHFARRVSGKIRTRAEAALMESRLVAWYELANDGAALTDEWVLRSGAGLVERLETTDYQESGRAALKSAQRRRQLGRRMPSPSLDGAAPITADVVRDRFRQVFPKGIVCEPGATPPEQLQGMSSAERREVMSSAIQYSKSPFASRRSRNFEVTTLCESGVIKWVFIVDKGEDAKLRAQWRAFITTANLGWEVQRNSRGG